MKTLAMLIAAMLPSAASAAPGSLVGSDGIFVWIFLGFCALIVVTQLIPAILLFIGMLRGIAAGTEVQNKSK